MKRQKLFFKTTTTKNPQSKTQNMKNIRGTQQWIKTIRINIKSVDM